MGGPGRMFEIGGRRLHAVVSGEGPSVILEAGGFAWSSDWWLVRQALGPGFRTLAYDRAGLGWSEPGPRPRSLNHHLDDLEALLNAAELPAPYIVAGASYGGMIARAFAARRPGDIAGLVLVDARHPATSSRLAAPWARMERQAMAVTGVMETLARLKLLAPLGRMMGEGQLPPAAASLPPTDRETYLAECFSPVAWRTSQDEARAIAESDAQAAQIGAPRDVPTIVLSHEKPDLFAALGANAAAAEAAWQAMQAELAAESGSGGVRVAANSGHAIPLQRPDLVAAAISELAALRN